MHFDPRLMYVTDNRITEDLPFFDILEQALAGGATLVQLREKTLNTHDYYQRALTCKQRCDAYNVPLIINDRADIALAVGAVGLHIGQQDLPYSVAREMLGEKALIGLSVSSEVQAQEAQHLEVDYIGVSPLFATQTKTQDLDPPLGLDGLAQIRKLFTGPIVVIGGVNTQNTAQAIAHGADGIAVVSAISGAADPKKATKELLIQL